MTYEVPKTLKLLRVLNIRAGRLNRTDYFVCFVSLLVLSAGFGFLSFLGFLNPLLFIFISVFIYYSWVSIVVKRFRDFGLSGWYAFILMVFQNIASQMLVNPTFVGVKYFGIDGTTIVVVGMLTFTWALILWPGQKSENKYGEYFEIFGNPFRKIIGNKVKFFS